MARKNLLAPFVCNKIKPKAIVRRGRIVAHRQPQLHQAL